MVLFYVCGSVRLGTMYMYMFNSGLTRCTLYSLFLSLLALRVLGAICTHYQEHNCRVKPYVMYLWKTEVLVSSGVNNFLNTFLYRSYQCLENAFFFRRNSTEHLIKS
jgi:hypothetical protein